ncbi:MAG: response regulator transcription factor, partial [Francisellaceae bacterium]
TTRVYSTSRSALHVSQRLKKRLDIGSFVYQKRFVDGSEIRLGTTAEWLLHFYKNRLYTCSVFEQDIKLYQSGFVLWQTLSHHKQVLNEARVFNIDHGMTYIQQVDDGVEFYFLGSHVDKPQTLNRMINNLNYIGYFIQQFKSQASVLLQTAKDYRIMLPETPRQPNHGLIANFAQISRDDADLQLTKTERRVAKEILNGATRLEIAEKFHRSPRTIETHIKHIKIKLKASSRSILIKKLHQLL